MPGSSRRVEQRANQGRWWGVAAFQGGESRNGGRRPGERGWGRSALRGGPPGWQPGRLAGGRDPVRRRAAGWPFCRLFFIIQNIA
ncbi:Diphosphomevalonate Decarboxylase [Manis pentadactyla]|nr:Diphosphomevalonate Decarboxylase [Manis pentadactyla]